MSLYIGDILVTPFTPVISDNMYNVKSQQILGAPDASGKMTLPTANEDIHLDFSGVTDIDSYVGSYKFYTNKAVKSVSFPSLTTISGDNGCYFMFNGCTSLTSVSFPSLTTISGNNGCYGMFSGCTSLTSVSLPNLTTISGIYGCGNMFNFCTGLTTVSLPNLTTVSGTNGCANMFNSCKNISDIYFPALTTSSFGSSYVNQFQNMMLNTVNATTHTIHFPSNLTSTISKLTGYPLFGGTSGYVVLSFDLPATE